MRFERPQSQDLTPPEEQLEKNQERLENVKKVWAGFIELKPEEKVLFVTDENTDRGFINALQQQLTSSGNEFKEIIVDAKAEKDPRVMRSLKNYHVLWVTWPMEEVEMEYWEKLVNRLERNKSRMVFAPGLKADALDNDGSLSEDRDILEYRLDKMENRLRDAHGFHIRSRYGTDLTVGLRKEERRWFKDTGVIKPGHWDNLPGGEIFTTPNETEVNGVLVLPVLQDEVGEEQGVDEFVRLTVRNGKIAKIDGGASAEKLRKYLQEASQDEEEDPTNVLQCAEVGFGANAKARSVVAKPEGVYTDIGHPTVETEKRLGTMHIAFGDTKHGEEGTEGVVKSEVHLDFVIPRNGLTVTVFNHPEDFQKKKNGERLIDEGRWHFLE